MRKFFGLILMTIALSGRAAKLEISVSLTPVGSFVAKGDSVQGALHQKDDKLIGQNIMFDLNGLSSGVALRDKHMKEKYFETAKFPQATLTKAVGKNGKFLGRLKIHDQLANISGTYKREGGTVLAKFKTSLSAFKIKEANYMGVGVDDEVEVKVQVPVN